MTTMFIFLTCIRHPDSSKNYTHIEALFEHTARSVCAQTDGNFRLVVVCNKKPNIELIDQRIIYLVVDFKVPKSRSEVLYDKGIKRMVGMIYCKNNFDVNYFMMLDADDLVSNTLVKDLIVNNENASQYGWWLENGYLFDFNNQRVQRKANLNNYCGSTLVLNANCLYEFSGINFDKFNANSSYDELILASSKEYYCDILGNHLDVIDFFKKKSCELKIFRGFSIAWVINNGENESKTSGKFSGLSLSERWCSEFSWLNGEELTNRVKDILYEVFLYKSSVLSSFFSKR